MKKLILIAVACFGFATMSFAADTVSEATTVSQQSQAEKVMSFIDKLYRYAQEDNIESFVFVLRQMEEFMENLTEYQHAQIEYQLASWYESNAYKVEVIAQYAEYVEDVLEGRIER
ncbi:MAG: hypothetical protein IKB15_04320 [Alistipes sp.]|nr:hypothetical protein [Alistipes sp.]